MSAHAELLDDGAAAASGAEFFRSRAFLEAEESLGEGRLHTLRVVGGEVELLAPVLVRTIGSGPDRDAVSPYGYPGLAPPTLAPSATAPPGERGASQPGPAAEPDQPPLDLAAIDFSTTGLVSAFIRHRLGPSPLGGAHERNVVQICDPSLPAKSRPSDRRQIRRNREAGYQTSLVAGPEATAVQRAGFLTAYEQTMVRTQAAPRYFFGAAYFDRLLGSDRSWLALVTAPGGEIAAASLAVLSDGYLHYYLSGSADSHLSASPMKNVLAALIEHAAALRLPLNLGGGLAPGDRLEEFKRGFANRSQAWFTSEIVCDPRRYAELSAGREAGSFFPAYRAPTPADGPKPSK